MKCKNPQCNNILPDNALYCPECGKKQTSAKKIIIVSVLIIALVASIILFFINSSVIKIKVAEIVEVVVEKVENIVQSLEVEETAEVADLIVEEVPKYELSRLNYENNVKTYKIDPSKKEFVDLGLPSGTLWAKCNIGATKPEEFGNYFAWGEVAPKFYYAKLTYKWWYDDTWTKYPNSGDTLELSDDVANVNWGGDWRMPTKSEIEELIKYTIYEIQDINGVKGYELTSKMNGNTIFFPQTGYIDGNNKSISGSFEYWSSSSSYYCAYCLYFNFCYNNYSSCTLRGVERIDRYKGLPVRPVKRKK